MFWQEDASNNHVRHLVGAKMWEWRQRQILQQKKCLGILVGLWVFSQECVYTHCNLTLCEAHTWRYIYICITSSGSQLWFTNNLKWLCHPWSARQENKVIYVTAHFQAESFWQWHWIIHQGKGNRGSEITSNTMAKQSQTYMKTCNSYAYQLCRVLLPFSNSKNNSNRSFCVVYALCCARGTSIVQSWFDETKGHSSSLGGNSVNLVTCCDLAH